MPRKKVQSGVASDTGQRRKNNEDSWLICEPEGELNLKTKGRLYAVADGMGGSVAGEIASRLAVRELQKYYFAEVPSQPPQEALRKAFQAAYESIRRKAMAEPELTGMGTTLTAVALRDNIAYVAHVGDSRAYLIRDKEIIQLTRDHTVTASLVEKGEITPEQAKTHPQRHVLLQALGGRKQPTVELLTVPVKPKDVFILCSDGLYNAVSDDEIKEIITSAPDIQKAAGTLVALANQRGGRDNITVVVVKKVKPANLLGAVLLTILTIVLIVAVKWIFF